MAPLLHIFARAAQLTHGFIGMHPHPPEAEGESAPEIPAPAPSPESEPGVGQIGQRPGDASSGTAEIRSDYVFYQGTGSLKDGWPDQDKWISFDDMWDANLPTVNSSCLSAGLASQDNSPADTNALMDAISKVSEDTGVDERLILAVVVQESKGCVRVRTTTSPGAAVRNPGVMQSHNGQGTCADQSLCPAATIHQMVKDGAGGTASGDGLKQCLGDAKGNSAEKAYRAARMYNSGSIAPSGDLGEGVATHCYASDIANRLQGWTDAPSNCTLDAPSWAY